MKRILTLFILTFALIGASSTVTGQAPQSFPAPAAIAARRQDTVYITNTGEKYHRGDCRYLSKSKIPIKRKDAIARGYAACKVCKP